MWTWKSSQTMSSDDDDWGCIVDDPQPSRNNVSRHVVELQGRTVQSFEGDTFETPATISDGKVKQDPEQKFVFTMLRIAFREVPEKKGAWLVDGTSIEVDENDPTLVKAMKKFFDKGEQVRRQWSLGVELSPAVKDDFAKIVKGLYPDEFPGKGTDEATISSESALVGQVDCAEAAGGRAGGRAADHKSKKRARGAAAGASGGAAGASTKPRRKKPLDGLREVLKTQHECEVEACHVLNYLSAGWNVLGVPKLNNRAPEVLQPTHDMLRDYIEQMTKIAGAPLQDASTRTCDKTLNASHCNAIKRLSYIHMTQDVCMQLFRKWNEKDPHENFDEWHDGALEEMSANIAQDMEDYA